MKTIIKNKNYTIEFNKLESLIIKDKEGNILFEPLTTKVARFITT